MRISGQCNGVDIHSFAQDKQAASQAHAKRARHWQYSTAIHHPQPPATPQRQTMDMEGLRSMVDAIKKMIGLFDGMINKLRETLSPNPTRFSPGKPGFVPFVPEPRVAPAVVTPVRPSPVMPEYVPGKKPDDIWGGFRQGTDGNCVTVSAIKAAMMRFGQKPRDIFKEVEKTEAGFDVVMRDGFKLQLTHDELQIAARRSAFLGNNRDMLDDAHFLFAASAKRAQLENNDRTAAHSFQQAIRTLNDGEHSREGLMRLGLREHVRNVPLSALLNGMVGTIERRGHSVAVIDGVEELWGRRGRTPYWPETITGLV
ncbi:hypothetical protein [Pseudomonas mucidolens]|uniref:Uncharacterized protein n=1 Tax=Pseudomonas mucidolens TaxID=46679 RepID=A0A1H2M6A1_9PSED|nr:hypothetical protein [Pseudomonas mucidolens]SDU88642.1 hypothetical protein SAMN05216202_1095 [Pseudomonas mucidolens]SQH34468.1 type III secretion effector protein [Pseudomonas mucidolens]